MAKIKEVVSLKTGYANFVELKSAFERISRGLFQPNDKWKWQVVLTTLWKRILTAPGARRPALSPASSVRPRLSVDPPLL